MPESCVRCDAPATWALEVEPVDSYTCARHLQAALADVPRGTKFSIRGLE
jgi:hypothetical protein